nr:Chain B, ALA-ALA-ALA-SER-VAL-LYS [synthetic construct]8SOV_B Chain B, ALA-ALA-ALA-SER-VAL-LYS [synthetic construct]8SPL_B Chain B, ALA-ALA-ALA-SER-VAL-LYS [synthetic construct]
AAASVK